jgi:uncharacterized SAM-binding protein YcdF (DUF218 family)
MGFIASKLLGQALVPMNFIVILVGISFFYLLTNHTRRAQWILGITLGLLCVIGFTPLPHWGVQTLEDATQHPRIDFNTVSGMIVLGGAFQNGRIPQERHEASLNSAAERMTKTIELARKHPHLRIIFTGFSGNLRPDGLPESALAAQFFEEQGISATRIAIEDRSRTTYENALYTRQIIPKGQWVLITSAAHMKRSKAVFDHFGIATIPLSVDYQTQKSPLWFEFDWTRGQSLWGILLHEWVGFGVYWITGKL